MTTNERTNEAANVRRTRRATVGLVFAGVAANALTQFAIQAFMSYRFAKDVWDIPRPLCVAVIIAMDLFAVMFMVFTYLLRNARWWTQAYVWFVFAGGVGAQLFAAEQYGSHAQWTQPVRIFAALPALFLAASLHGLIIWRNHAAATVRPVAPAPIVKTVRTETREPAPKAVERKPEPAPKLQPQPQPVAAGRTGHPQRAEAVRRVVEDKEDTKVVAADLHVTRRAVQNWVKTAPAAEPQQINGHAFTPGAATEAQVN